MLISRIKGERWDHRVTAVVTNEGSVMIHEGEKSKSDTRFQETCVILTREEIARLAEKFPVIPV